LGASNASAAIITSTNFTDFPLTPLLSGIEYIKNGEEDFDLIFSGQQNSFAMNYVHQSAVRTFSLRFSTAPRMWGARAS
tara:strand:- start:97 stop:333 length:237 start_codon:yes stop_codon:yes gene_type:complete